MGYPLVFSVSGALNLAQGAFEGLVVPHDLRKMDLPERPWRNNRG